MEIKVNLLLDAPLGHRLIIRLLNEAGNRIEIMASEYECLYGPNKSQLLVDMHNECTNGSDLSLPLDSPPCCCLLAAIRFMHTNEMDLNACDVITWARNAQFLNIVSLEHKLKTMAIETINTRTGTLNLWHACAILTLLCRQADEEERLLAVVATRVDLLTVDIMTDPLLYELDNMFFTPQQLSALTNLVFTREIDNLQKKLFDQIKLVQDRTVLVNQTEDILNSVLSNKQVTFSSVYLTSKSGAVHYKASAATFVSVDQNIMQLLIPDGGLVKANIVNIRHMKIVDR